MGRMRTAAFAVLAAAVVAFALVYLVAPSSSPRPAPKISAPAVKIPPPPKNAAVPTTPQYFRVRVAFDGTLKTDRHTFYLYAADVPSREYTCAYRNGQRWACGLRAHVALINLIGSALIKCAPKDMSEADVVICRLGNIDLSKWMLANGWAHLHDGVTARPYVEAAKAALAAQVGMWLPNPPKQNTSVR
jgi:endonuclease YncB( thermonuclease family)